MHTRNKIGYGFSKDGKFISNRLKSLIERCVVIESPIIFTIYSLDRIYTARIESFLCIEPGSIYTPLYISLDIKNEDGIHTEMFRNITKDYTLLDYMSEFVDKYIECDLNEYFIS